MSSLYTELRKDYIKTWRIWYAINQRCDPVWRAKGYNGTQNGYYEIVDEWSIKEYGQEGFINFFDSVGDLEHVSDLHRKDTSKPYGPHNWVKGDPTTRTRVNIVYLSDRAIGRRRAIANNIPTWVYYDRLKQGMSIQSACTCKYTRRRKTKTKSKSFTQKLAGLVGLQ